MSELDELKDVASEVERGKRIHFVSQHAKLVLSSVL